jgi:hypothetical protein
MLIIMIHLANFKEVSLGKKLKSMEGQDSISGRGKEYCFLFDTVQTGSGAHPTSYPIDTGDSFLEGTAARARN